MQAILFDLDGTLLPMDMEAFTKGYFQLLAKKAAPRGYEPQALVSGIWAGTKAMVKNDGTKRNMERFWEAFAAIFGDKVYADVPVFDDFYTHEFGGAAAFTTPSPDKARRAVAAARRAAKTVILATNPIFPLVGVRTRLSWIGLAPEDFDYVTSYENASFCKPNPAYYTEICKNNRLLPTDCLMIGNDVGEDILPASGLGMATYLVKDCILNVENATYDSPEGTFEDMISMLENL